MKGLGRVRCYKEGVRDRVWGECVGRLGYVWAGEGVWGLVWGLFIGPGGS